MKTRTLLILLLCMLPAYGRAQVVPSRKYQPVEVEVGIGTGIPLNRLGAEKFGFLKTVKGEIRYNTPAGVFDFGAGVQLMKVGRIFNQGEAGLKATDYSSLQLYGVVDYNWRVNHYMNLFAGLAFGASHNISLMPDGFSYAKKWSPYVGPRIGMEVWDRLRVTITCNLMDRANNFIGFEIGYAFGGKQK